jgi:hypothetical protein
VDGSRGSGVARTDFEGIEAGVRGWESAYLGLSGLVSNIRGLKNRFWGDGSRGQGVKPPLLGDERTDFEGMAARGLGVKPPC